MAVLHVTGSPLAPRQADLTPLQAAFLAWAVPRAWRLLHHGDSGPTGAQQPARAGARGRRRAAGRGSDSGTRAHLRAEHRRRTGGR